MTNESEEKILLAKAEDAVFLCEKQYRVKTVGFLTPGEAALVKKHFSGALLPYGVSISFFGGYPEAERCLFVAAPDYAEETEISENISAIEITGRELDSLSHRDYLGSLLGLGIKREKIGDILTFEGRALVFVLSDIAGYILGNLDKVGRKGVKVCEVELGEIKVPRRKVEEIRTTVAALRLDCVVAAAIKGSRSQAAETINSGKVYVNWLECDNLSVQLKPGDVFSVRGVGRFRLSEYLHETKKGRLGICIEKSL